MDEQNYLKIISFFIKMRVVIFSLYASPPHEGHMQYAANARKLAGPDGIVYAIVNNDKQAILKKGFSFMPENDRLAIIGSLKYVDKAFLSIDTDRTCCKTIQMIYDNDANKPTHWFNEGDVGPNNKCPEEHVCLNNNIEVYYGEAPKIQSSTWILENSVKAAYDIMFSNKQA